MTPSQPNHGFDRSPSDGRHTATLDEKSLQIIAQLQQDGRRPYAVIGREVGLSEAAVRQRVAKLIEQDVIQIVGVTNPLQVGHFRQALATIKVSGPMQPVVDALTALDEVSYAIACAGPADLIAELVCEDDEHLLRLLDEKIRSLPGVRDVQTYVYLRLEKQTYGFGVR